MAEPQKKFLTIDGKEYEIPKIKFKALKQLYPVVQAVQNAEDPMDMATAAIEVVSICMIKQHPDMTPEWIEDNIDVEESAKLGTFVSDIMIRAGLMTQEVADAALSGESQQPTSSEAADLGMGTSIPSSQNSLPQDAVAQTGTQ